MKKLVLAHRYISPDPERRLASFVIKNILTIFKRRGKTTGRKRWEKRALFLAYEAMGTPEGKRHESVAEATSIASITAT